MILVVNSLIGHHEMYIEAFRRRYEKVEIWGTVQGEVVNRYFLNKRALISELRIHKGKIFFLSLNEWQWYLPLLFNKDVHGIFYHQNNQYNLKNIIRMLMFKISNVEINLLLYMPKIWSKFLGNKCHVIPDPFMGEIFPFEEQLSNKIRIGFFGEISERKGFFNFLSLVDRLDSNMFEFVCYGNSVLNPRDVQCNLDSRSPIVEYCYSRLGDKCFQEKMKACHLIFMDYSLLDGSSGILSLSSMLHKPVLFRQGKSFLSNHIIKYGLGIEINEVLTADTVSSILELIPKKETFDYFNEKFNSTDAFFEQMSI